MEPLWLVVGNLAGSCSRRWEHLLLSMLPSPRTEGVGRTGVLMKLIENSFRL